MVKDPTDEQIPYGTTLGVNARTSSGNATPVRAEPEANERPRSTPYHQAHDHSPAYPDA